MPRAGRIDLRSFQQDLAARLAARDAVKADASRLAVESDGRLWLVRLSDAGEVLPAPPIAQVPLTRRWFAGLANVRGRLYGVTDLQQLLGGGPTPPGQARLVLFGPRYASLGAALLVSRVLGLRSLDALTLVAGARAGPAWQTGGWEDGAGTRWGELDLAVLACDPEFVQVGC